jgi:hypothetical protein
MLRFVRCGFTVAGRRDARTAQATRPV